MITKLFLAAALIVLVAMVFLPGCLRRSQEKAIVPSQTAISGTLQKIGSAPAGAVVSSSMQPFFRAGLALVVIGGLVAGFLVKRTGLMLIILGVGITGVGVLFIQYPWVVLAFALLGVGVAGLAVYKMRGILPVFVKFFEEHPEFKKQLCDGDKEKQEQIRPEIRAVKTLLGIPVT